MFRPKSLAPAATTICLCLPAFAPASAHVTLEAGAAPAGSTYRAVLRVPHGCDGAATTAIRVEIPEGMFGVKPMPHAGWSLATETGTYVRDYDNHGETLREGVTAVTWSGGDLPDAFYDEFVFRGTLAADLPTGSALAFPVIQRCGDRTVAWTATPGAEGEPAPVLKITAAMATDHGHHMKMGGMAMGAAVPAPEGAPVTLGDLVLEGAFARATLPKAPVGGGFLAIRNAGSTDDRLVAASATFADRVEIHEMKMEGDRMQMRPLPEGLLLPKGETVTLKPGGFHLMFMGLKQPLTEGETAEVTLTFEKAGSVTLPLQVLGTDARSAHQH